MHYLLEGYSAKVDSVRLWDNPPGLICIKKAIIMKKTAQLLVSFICISASLLTGCAGVALSARPQVNITEYEKENYQTSIVQRSDITPILGLSLKSSNKDTKAYGMLEETLAVDEILVENGDHVKPGDVLVRFSSKDDEERENQLRGYNERKEEDLLMIEHFTILQGMDKETDYQTDIDLLQDDVALMDVYIDELNRRQAMLSLKTDVEGIVTDINEDMYKGYAMAASSLVRVTFGTEDYIAETDDSYEFKVGDVYEGYYGKAAVDMRVTEVAKNGAMQMVSFCPNGDASAIEAATIILMDIQKPVIKDAVYVEKDAIVKVDDVQYVYLIDDRGFRSVREVTTGSDYGDYIVITSGLDGGEQVVIF